MPRILSLRLVAALMLTAPLALNPAGALADAKNNVLTIGFSSEPFTLYPAMGVSGNDYPYLYSIYARILTFDPKSLQPRPGLAESWEFSPDKKIFRFKLRENLTFQDGTTLDATAVKASLMDFKENGRSQDLEVVQSIDTPDARTVVINLDRPYSPMTAILADRAGMVISPTALKAAGKDFDRKPVGAGAFMVKSWTAGSNMELVPFPGYWDKSAIKLSGITFKFIANATSLASAALAGQVDYAFGLDPKNLPALKANPRLRVAIEPSFSLNQIGIHLGYPPMENVLVRRAVSMSIDRRVLRDAILGKDLGEGPTALMVPPTLAFKSSPQFAESIKYDPVKAKQLLAEAGYPDGITLKICASPGGVGTGTDATDIEREQMKPAGISLNVTLMTGPACLQAYNLRREFQLWQGGWSGRPHRFMTYSQYFGTQGQYNKAKTKFPGVDETLDKIAATDDLEQQEVLFAELDRLWAENMPVVPLFSRPNFAAYSVQVAGETPNAQGKVDPTSIYFIANQKK
jgi:ABC-type transport system substrate-binding protein